MAGVHSLLIYVLSSDVVIILPDENYFNLGEGPKKHLIFGAGGTACYVGDAIYKGATVGATL